MWRARVLLAESKVDGNPIAEGHYFFACEGDRPRPGGDHPLDRPADLVRRPADTRDAIRAALDGRFSHIVLSLGAPSAIAVGRDSFPRVTACAAFDFAAFVAAFEGERRVRGLGWYDLAEELWQQSSELNTLRMDHPLCGGAVSRLGTRGATSCQYALFMLRWLGRAPEEFLTGPVVDVGDVRLPEPGPGSRLRWDLNQVHAALNQERQLRGLTWAELAQTLGCTPSRLTNLRTARMADLDLTMRVTQWLGKPAAEFIHPAQW